METNAVNREKRRIAIFLPALWGGGAERTMLNLAHGFLKRGFAVDLVLAQRAGPYLSEVSDEIRLVELAAEKQIKKHHTLRSLPALIRYLRTEKPEALLASMFPANIVAVSAKRLSRYPKRVVINEQNTLTFQAGNSRNRLIRWSPKLANVFYPWADHVVCVSQGVADDLVNTLGLNSKNVTVVHNPGITDELRLKVQESIDHPWFRKGQPPIILAVGSLTEQKDFANLISAFAAVRKKQAARLLILGEGRLRSALEAQIRELALEDDVKLPGFVSNPYPYMSRASAFVLSSRWEGLPTVLVEALFCGPPLVATDCPSGPREILKGGRLGCLVPVGDTRKLAAGIEKALAGGRSKVTDESWRPYDLELIVDQYLELLVN